MTPDGSTPATHRHLDDFELWAFELATRADGYDPTTLPALLAQLDGGKR